jgi:hypothetical protein
MGLDIDFYESKSLFLINFSDSIKHGRSFIFKINFFMAGLTLSFMVFTTLENPMHLKATMELMVDGPEYFLGHDYN